ncbi:hypothetical protein NLI96_g4047 [Meripilus lineatus]|uniref:Peptidase M20 dimerisation domain-containing protein n=1 Tax=Meripilus lineatus TaxID=2056292 RepID=A0AAD5V7P4_9APHY|nr:hypothetical protein NLI96_g4047 [Physisporinus lineatus]
MPNTSKKDIFQGIPIPAVASPRSKTFIYPTFRTSLAFLSGIAIFLTFFRRQDVAMISVGSGTPVPRDSCPQVASITPLKHLTLLEQLEETFVDENFRQDSYHKLGGAVQIPTVTYDDLRPPGEDSRWDIYVEFHQFLASSFPLVHSILNKTTVNSYALAYHWQGSDTSLKPVLLTAHQGFAHFPCHSESLMTNHLTDVVPIDPDTLQEWIHPPFSGTFDAIESLLQKGFKPTRTVVLAYGIDEERGGISGATAIRDYLLSNYGKNAFSILVDEGGGHEIRDNIIIATPSVAEKGHFDLRMRVSAPGGHSSVPPDHTTIGILAALIVELEAHPYTPHLYRNDVYYTNLQCQAAYDPDLDTDFRALIARSLTSDKALSELEDKIFKSSLQIKAMGSTTQATDIIHGGVKVNALPEEAFAVVNHRIATYSSVSAVKAHIAATLLPVVKKLGLSLEAFGQEIEVLSRETIGRLSLTDAWGTALEPAPVTPTTGNPAYEFLSGTIISTAKSTIRTNHTDKPVIVAPGIPTGS